MPMRRAILLPGLLAMALAGVPGQATAQQPPANRPKPCSQAMHRQFDFWIGEWTVSDPDGKPVGRSRIEAALDRCVIHEHWTGAGGSNGQSFNIYNTATRQWEQFWVDNGGNRLHLKGGLVDGAMVLRGTQDVANAKSGLTQDERITWTPNAYGSVRQRWETSTDDGKTWTVAFDGIYRKATTPAS